MKRAGPPPTLARQYLRSMAALVAALLAATVALVLALVAWPMAQRAADDLAGLMQLAAQTWVELPPDTRPAFEDELRRAHRLAILADLPPPADVGLRHGFYVRFLERALARRQGHEVFLERRSGPDDGTWLWTALNVGDRTIGVGFDYERLNTHPLTAVAATFVLGAAAAGLGAWWLARRTAAPVARLERAAAQLAAGRDPQPIPEDGALEIARLAAYFNTMAARVHELLKARTTLLAGVSHDLRTPLARTRLALEMLRTQPDPALIDRIERDVETMNALIGQMLDLARGLSREAPQDIALAAWLHERAEAHAADARAHGATIAVECDPGLRVRAAAGLLARVVDNLLDNALRHAGGVVELRARTEAASRAVVVEVADRGPGIAAQRIDAAWRPFERGDASRSPYTGGFGLGLAIVRQLAHTQGWAVRLDHRPGGGLVARVELPAQAA